MRPIVIMVIALAVTSAAGRPAARGLLDRPPERARRRPRPRASRRSRPTYPAFRTGRSSMAAWSRTPSADAALVVHEDRLRHERPCRLPGPADISIDLMITNQSEHRRKHTQFAMPGGRQRVIARW